jgi:hypothetical protein
VIGSPVGATLGFALCGGVTGAIWGLGARGLRERQSSENLGIPQPSEYQSDPPALRTDVGMEFYSAQHGPPATGHQCMTNDRL